MGVSNTKLITDYISSIKLKVNKNIMINEETAQKTTTASSYCFKNPMIELQGTKICESLKASLWPGQATIMKK